MRSFWLFDVWWRTLRYGAHAVFKEQIMRVHDSAVRGGAVDKIANVYEGSKYLFEQKRVSKLQTYGLDRP